MYDYGVLRIIFTALQVGARSVLLRTQKEGLGERIFISCRSSVIYGVIIPPSTFDLRKYRTRHRVNSIHLVGLRTRPSPFRIVEQEDKIRKMIPTQYFTILGEYQYSLFWVLGRSRHFLRRHHTKIFAI